MTSTDYKAFLISELKAKQKFELQDDKTKERLELKYKNKVESIVESISISEEFVFLGLKGVIFDKLASKIKNGTLDINDIISEKSNNVINKTLIEIEKEVKSSPDYIYALNNNRRQSEVINKSIAGVVLTATQLKNMISNYENLSPEDRKNIARNIWNLTEEDRDAYFEKQRAIFEGCDLELGKEAGRLQKRIVDRQNIIKEECEGILNRLTTDKAFRNFFKNMGVDVKRFEGMEVGDLSQDDVKCILTAQIIYINLQKNPEENAKLAKKVREHFPNISDVDIIPGIVAYKTGRTKEFERYYAENLGGKECFKRYVTDLLEEPIAYSVKLEECSQIVQNNELSPEERSRMIRLIHDYDTKLKEKNNQMRKSFGLFERKSTEIVSNDRSDVIITSSNLSGDSQESNNDIELSDYVGRQARESIDFYEDVVGDNSQEFDDMLSGFILPPAVNLEDPIQIQNDERRAISDAEMDNFNERHSETLVLNEVFFQRINGLDKIISLDDLTSTGKLSRDLEDKPSKIIYESEERDSKASVLTEVVNGNQADKTDEKEDYSLKQIEKNDVDKTKQSTTTIDQVSSSKNLPAVQETSFFKRIGKAIAVMRDSKQKDPSKGFFKRLRDSLQVVFSKKKTSINEEKESDTSTNINSIEQEQFQTNSFDDMLTKNVDKSKFNLVQDQTKTNKVVVKGVEVSQEDQELGE